jgi:hypothetical protein
MGAGSCISNCYARHRGMILHQMRLEIQRYFLYSFIRIGLGRRDEPSQNFSRFICVRALLDAGKLTEILGSN